MKRILFGMMAVFACAVQAISLNWTSSADNSWAKGLDITAGTLVYADSASAEATAADIAKIAKGETTSLSGYTEVAPENGRFSWPENQENGLQGDLEITESETLKTSGTFYMVLFTKDGKYAVGAINGAETTERGGSYWYEPGPVESGFTYPEYDVTFDGTAVVPEPTALALLALGIAGLALRRRA